MLCRSGDEVHGQKGFGAPAENLQTGFDLPARQPVCDVAVPGLDHGHHRNSHRIEPHPTGCHSGPVYRTRIVLNRFIHAGKQLLLSKGGEGVGTSGVTAYSAYSIPPQMLRTCPVIARPVGAQRNMT